MNSFHFSLGQLLFVLVSFPVAVGVVAASSFGAFLADDVFGQTMTQVLRSASLHSFYARVIAQDVTDFIGIALPLALLVTLLAVSRLAPVRHFGSLVILAVPIFVGIQEYLLTRDDLNGSVLQDLQEYFYYRWDVLVVVMGIMGVLWWVRAHVTRSRPGTLSVREWHVATSIVAKLYTGLLVVGTLSIAVVGFLWLRDLSRMGGC